VHDKNILIQGLRMGKLGIGRNNQLSQNGLLYDSDGNVFDLTEWYKVNSFELTAASINTQNAILETLKRIELHLAIITDEELTPGDED